MNNQSSPISPQMLIEAINNLGASVIVLSEQIARLNVNIERIESASLNATTGNPLAEIIGSVAANAIKEMKGRKRR